MRGLSALARRALFGLPLVLGVIHVVLFGYVVIQRFRVPLELEWMSGGIADHVERVLAHKPLYVAPTASFIPYLYPPLHYWLTAAVAHVMSISAAGRAVSIAATLVTGFCVNRATFTLTRSPYWALVAAALFVGAYSYTGYWYDLDRSDTLVVAMLSAAFVVLLMRPGVRPALVAGLLLGSAFFAKQPALVFLLTAFGALALARRFREAVAVAVSGAVALVFAVAWLTSATDGWFWFYCVKMPAAHGIDCALWSRALASDALKALAITGATFATVARLLARSVHGLRVGRPIERREALLGAFVLAAIVASCSSRLHFGGYVNGLIFFATFGAIAFSVLGARLSRAGRAPALHAAAALVASAQLGYFAYDPEMACPNEARARHQLVVAARVRALEEHGEVIVQGRGHLTKPRHFHVMALTDLLRAGLLIPEDLARGLRSRAYAAYVIDDFRELSLEVALGHRSDLYELVLRNYFVAERLDDRQPRPVVGGTAHPSWVLRPRRTPLDGLTSAQVERRQWLEAVIAERRMRSGASTSSHDDGDDIEELAAGLDTARSP
jgi:hypothetical protein